MAVKTPVKATFTGSDVTGLAEYQAADFIGVSDGGTGAVTFTAGLLTADGTNAFSTVTAPSGTIVGTSDTQTLTNKTINSASNTITITESNISDLGSYITSSSTDTLSNKTIDSASNTLTLDLGEGTLTGTTAEFNSALSDGSFATLAGTETLTNKTINSASNTITITESNISDLGSYITASSTDTLTNKTIDAANNTLSNIGNSSLTNSSITVTDGSTSTATSLGGTITFSGTANEIEVGESSGTITVGLPDNVTIGGNATITGNLTVNGTTTTINSTTVDVVNSFRFEGSSADDYETNLTVVDPTADRTITLPNATGTVSLLDNTETLTNKTIDADNNTITNIGDDELSSGISATKIGNGDVDNTELSYLNGVTSAIQTQIDTKASTAFAIAQAVALG